MIRQPELTGQGRNPAPRLCILLEGFERVRRAMAMNRSRSDGEQQDASPVREQPATTVSGRPIKPLYTADDLEDAIEPGSPGEYPFTRGVHASMYRGRLWTMRQFAGFGTPRQTNERFKFLLEKGQTGLSTAFDLPTLMGLDSDDPQRRWAKSAGWAWRWTRSTTCSRCSTASTSSKSRCR